MSQIPVGGTSNVPVAFDCDGTSIKPVLLAWADRTFIQREEVVKEFSFGSFLAGIGTTIAVGVVILLLASTLAPASRYERVYALGTTAELGTYVLPPGVNLVGYADKLQWRRYDYEGVIFVIGDRTVVEAKIQGGDWEIVPNSEVARAYCERVLKYQSAKERLLHDTKIKADQRCTAAGRQ